MIKRHIILTIVGTIIFTTNSVHAESNEIKSKINPGNIFYFADRGLENIKLKFINDEQKRLDYLSSLALERWSEVESAKSTNKIELINIAQDGYETAITEILNIVEDTNEAQIYEVLNKTEDILVQDLEQSTLEQAPKEEVTTEEINKEEIVTETTTEENTQDLDIENKEIAKLIFGQEISEDLLNKISSLNLMEITTIKSFADQSGKSVEEVYNIFIENEKGIGITANKLNIGIKDGMENLKEDYKKSKETEKEYKKSQKENKSKNKNKEKKEKEKKEKNNKNKNKNKD
jgi:hypothetical protein